MKYCVVTSYHVKVPTPLLHLTDAGCLPSICTQPHSYWRRFVAYEAFFAGNSLPVCPVKFTLSYLIQNAEVPNFSFKTRLAFSKIFLDTRQSSYFETLSLSGHCPSLLAKNVDSYTFFSVC